MMDMKLKPFDFASAVARAGLRTDGTPIGGTGGAGALGRTAGAAKGDFGTAMADALKSVSDSQNEATRMQNELQLDNPTVSLEQTMVQMQKAQVGFQAVLSVRNRLVQSYTDIMNMQV
jgi:flagellar hook-basal body complex protein FliE